MTEDRPNLTAGWVDDDLPEWSDDRLDRAAFCIGDDPVRPAGSSLTRPGPRSASPKQQITLRLDGDVLAAFRATGPGWQSRINAALRRTLKLDA